MKTVETNLRRITLCGGGNGAHAIWALLARSCDAHLTLFLPLENEFREFTAVKKSGAPFRLSIKGEKTILSMDKLSLASDPEEAAAADLIIIVLPAFAHGPVLEALAPHLQPGTIVAALPARGGFEFQASAILDRYHCQDVTIAGFQTLPWACRIGEYARSVEVYGQKDKLRVATLPPGHVGAAVRIFDELLEPEIIPSSNMLELTLGNQGQLIHPGIMYGAFADKLNESYQEGEIPPFYQSVNERTAALLEAMSQEILEISKAIQSNFSVPLEGVVSISQWMLESYAKDIEDKSSLARMFQTNRSYRGLTVPVKLGDHNLYRIDVRARYLAEDVPYGLLVSRSIAELAGVNTPRINEVIEQTSRWMGAQYLVDGRLRGKDLAGTRIPQNFGLNSLEEIVELIA